MKLLRQSIRHLKGIHSQDIDYSGNDTTIRGRNGTKKTTIKDAFFWLLFGKNSEGKTSFDIRPHTKDGKAIEGLILMSSAVLEINGNEVELKKENHEKKNQGKINGFETFCWINDVSKSVTEFKQYISEIAPDDIIKLITDLSYFNDDKKNHWIKRRELLMIFAQDIGIPEGFDDLVESAEVCRSSEKELPSTVIENYKKLLKERVNGKKGTKGYKELQADIPISIKEVMRTLTDLDDSGKDDLEAERDTINKEIEALSNARTEVKESETERQGFIDQVNKLKGEKITREAVLENDTSKVREHINEKKNIENSIETGNGTVRQAKSKVSEQEDVIKRVENNLSSAVSLRDTISSEKKALVTKIAVDENTLSEKTLDTVCDKCNQTVPADKVEELKAAKKEAIEELKAANKKALDNINERGKKQFGVVKETRKLLEDEKTKLVGLKELLEHEEIKLQESLEAKAERFVFLNNVIEKNETPKPAEDDKWIEISNQITELEKKIGDPVTEQLQEIDDKKEAKDTELTAVKDKLINFDNATKSKARIAELNAEEVKLGQKIADIERELKDIEKYKTVQNKMIEDAVNDKFEHVTFRMFTENIGDDGGKDDCTAIYRGSGTAYPDCSTGEKIFVNNDIVNVLSKHFDIDIPRFIDNAESLTLPLESDSQIIRLFADENCPELKVQ